MPWPPSIRRVPRPPRPAHRPAPWRTAAPPAFAVSPSLLQPLRPAASPPLLQAPRPGPPRCLPPHGCALREVAGKVGSDVDSSTAGP
ncbi:hypothetical protein ACP70R_007561 [Stipagrostis hirtigluma subsp. patula]